MLYTFDSELTRTVEHALKLVFPDAHDYEVKAIKRRSVNRDYFANIIIKKQHICGILGLYHDDAHKIFYKAVNGNSDNERNHYTDIICKCFLAVFEVPPSNTKLHQIS